RIGISLPLSKKILDAAEKGIIKLTESVALGDAIVTEGKAIITANDYNELLEKLRRVVSS
ncbi:MAG: bifunctional hydroxymethylpyrimidine kinase/phosphomethylpyrimidine kinase, partial [Metallosphaera sp.]